MAPSLQICAYWPGDELRFRPRGDFAAEGRVNAWNWAEGPPPGRVWSLWRLSGCVGVAGGIPKPDGVWWLWASLAGDLTPREWLEAIGLARRAMDGLALFNGAVAFVATARDASPAAVRVLERLGFDTVGTHSVAVDGRAVPYRFMWKAA